MLQCFIVQKTNECAIVILFSQMQGEYFWISMYINGKLNEKILRNNIRNKDVLRYLEFFASMECIK